MAKYIVTSYAGFWIIYIYMYFVFNSILFISAYFLDIAI